MSDEPTVSEEARTRHLFAVSDFPDENERLRDPAYIARIPDVVAAMNAGTYVRVHRADFDLARAWIARAASVSTQEVDAMPRDSQYDAVAALWTAFGNALRALNLRPQTFTAFRRACQRAWGYWDERSADHNVVVRHFKGYAWSESGTGEVVRAVRVAADGVQPPLGAWRLQVIEQGGSVVFGEYDPYGFGGLHDLGSENPARATGERHRLWLRTTGLVDKDYSDETRVDWHPVDPARRTWRSFGLSSLHTPPMETYVPPMRAYWDLLRAPGQTSEGAPAPSVVDFLRASIATDEAATEFLRATWKQMIDRNNDCASAWEMQGLLSAATARRAALDDMQRGESDRRVTQALTDGVSGAVGALATAVIGPAGLLVSGALRLATDGVQRLFTGPQQTNAHVDVFGRLCPALEQFEMVQRPGEFLAMMRDPIMRAPGLTLAGALSLLPPPVFNFTVAPATVPVRIVGMPPYGGLTIDGADAIAGGHWETSDEAVWIAQATPGTHAVTVTAPGGAWTVRASLEVSADGAALDVPAAHARAEARGLFGGGVNTDGTPAGDAGSGTPPAPRRGHMTSEEKVRMVADINPGALTADAGPLKDGGTPPPPRTATLAIVRMPPYGGLFVDGENITSRGAWQDDAQTVYAAPVAIGRHDVRVTPPDGSWERTATLDVTAAGAVLDVGRTAPQSAGAGQQSNTPQTRGLLLAAAVGLGALAVGAVVAASD